MTQASLSPDLHGALGAQPAVPDSGRPAATSEAAFWMITITSAALVLASLVLLGLIGANVIADASLGGFVAGISIVIAALGVGGVSYALVTARRAGYLDLSPPAPSVSWAVPAGLHIVPAVPPDLGRRKRQQLEAERAARSRQAKAIATAAVATTRKPAPSAPPRQSPSMAGPRTAPRRAAAPPVQPHAARPLPVAPIPVRMATAPARSRPVSPTPHRAPASAPPVITMPHPRVRQPRPAAWPSRAPVVRMAPPPMRPRTQVAVFQVHAANVRAATPVRPR